MGGRLGTKTAMALAAASTLGFGACGGDPAPAAPPPAAPRAHYGPPPGWPPPPPPVPPPPPAQPCAPEGTYACAPDRLALLQCRGGRMAVASTCRGARRCAEGTAVACDSSVAAPGDPCDEPGGVSCGLDRRTLLRCLQGAFRPAETCRNACLSTSGRVLCQ